MNNHLLVLLVLCLLAWIAFALLAAVCAARFFRNAARPFEPE